METTQLKHINLSTEMMDAAQISTFTTERFLQISGNQTVGDIALYDGNLTINNGYLNVTDSEYPNRVYSIGSFSVGKNNVCGINTARVYFVFPNNRRIYVDNECNLEMLVKGMKSTVVFGSNYENFGTLVSCATDTQTFAGTELSDAQKYLEFNVVPSNLKIGTFEDETHIKDQNGNYYDVNSPVVASYVIFDITNYNTYTLDFSQHKFKKFNVFETYYKNNYIFFDDAPLFGNKSNAIKTYVVAEGMENKAFGLYSHVEGLSNVTHGKYSHAEGRKNYVEYMGHVEGYENEVYAYISHSEGRGNKVYPTNGVSLDTYMYSHAEGRDNEIHGQCTHVQGQSNIVYGSNVHVGGKDNRISGDYTFVHGQKISADVDSSSSFIWSGKSSYQVYNRPGSFNVNPANGIDGFYIGDSKLGDTFVKNGQSINNLSANNSIIVGDYATGGSTSYASGSFGVRNEVYGYGSYAFGRENSIYQNYGSLSKENVFSFACGRENVISGKHSVCQGYQNQVVGNCSIGIGNNTKLSANNSFAWNGKSDSYNISGDRYGTFNINPSGGISGFYIGDHNFISCIVTAIKNMTVEQKNQIKSALGI